jgi:hypothetical protein
MANKIWATGFYWIGVVMTLASFTLILAGNTELLWRFEHSRFPLSWMFAGVAILAFLVAELGLSGSAQRKEEPRAMPLAPEYETADF